MDGHAFVKFCSDPGEGANVVWFIDADGEVVGHAPFKFRLVPFTMNEQGRGNAGIAELRGFFECAQAKAPGTFLQYDASHVDGSVAIGVVFDDCEDFYVRRKVAADALYVPARAAEINFDPGGAWRQIGV